MPRPSGQLHGIKTVVAATDLSRNALLGLAWAKQVAERHEARLVLVHSIALATWAMEYDTLRSDLEAQLRGIASEDLRKLAAKAETEDIEVSWRIDVGYPSQVITRLAQEESADLIVLGTRGLRGLDHLLLGSTAERVVQCAPCPVLTVPPQVVEKPRPIQSILVATDFSQEASLALEAALALRARPSESIRLELLHAYHVPYEVGMEGAYGSAAAGMDLWKGVEQGVRHKLEALAAPLRSQGLEVSLHTLEGFPPETIVEQADLMGVDLIAMGTRGRTGLSHVLLGSTAERVVQRARCPVLTVGRRCT